MNFQIKVMQEAKNRGWKLPLTQAQYDACSLAVRTTKEKIRDGIVRGESILSNTTGARKVSLPVYNDRLVICRSNECGSYGKLAGGEEVCHRCSCNGKNLDYKIADPHQYCPAGLWGVSLK